MRQLSIFTMLVGLCTAVFLSCAHKLSQTQVPPPPAPPRIEMVQYKECTLLDKVATCECTPVKTKIDSKTGKTSVVCHLHVR